MRCCAADKQLETIPLVWNRDITAPKGHSGSISALPKPQPHCVGSPFPSSAGPPLRCINSTPRRSPHIWNFKCKYGKIHSLLAMLCCLLPHIAPFAFRLICPDAERAVSLHLLAQKPPRLTHRAVLAVMLMFAAAAGYLKDADDADDARGPLQCAASSGQ